MPRTPVTEIIENLIINRIALEKQGDNALDSIHPSVCVFVCLCVLSKENHYKSIDLVCVSVISFEDVVDQLFI